VKRGRREARDLAGALAALEAAPFGEAHFDDGVVKPSGIVAPGGVAQGLLLPGAVEPGASEIVVAKMLVVGVAAGDDNAAEDYRLGAVGSHDDGRQRDVLVTAEVQTRQVEVHRDIESAVVAGDVEVLDRHEVSDDGAVSGSRCYGAQQCRKYG